MPEARTQKRAMLITKTQKSFQTFVFAPDRKGPPARIPSSQSIDRPCPFAHKIQNRIAELPPNQSI
jgi:hypothetical protein